MPHTFRGWNVTAASFCESFFTSVFMWSRYLQKTSLRSNSSTGGVRASDVVWQTDSCIYLYFYSYSIALLSGPIKQAARPQRLHLKQIYMYAEWYTRCIYFACGRMFADIFYFVHSSSLITEQWKESRERRTVAVRRMKRQIAACFYVFLPQII